MNGRLFQVWFGLVWQVRGIPVTFPGPAEEQEEDLNLIRGFTPKLLDRVNKVIFDSCSCSCPDNSLLLIQLVKVCKLLEVNTANFHCSYIDLNDLAANNTPTMDWDS